ncbi:addiction module protein [Methylovulum miyakonense]|uniref:addiction module protein n=1 Tax=Methylovulum miyakonense TaxID=645578 RepID=UPI001E35B87F|nr:addiction module protein [Methylovulum miyakonense]
MANSENEQLFGFLIMNIQAIEQEVLHLPIEERARLAEKLLSSLDALSEQEIEKLWLVEAQRRASEIDNGTVRLVSAEEVERKIQAILQ